MHPPAFHDGRVCVASGWAKSPLAAKRLHCAHTSQSQDASRYISGMRMPRVFGLAAQPWPGSQQAISKCRRFDIPLSPPSPSPCETGAPIATMAAQDQDGEGGYKEHRAAIEIPAVSRGEKATRVSALL